MLGPNFQPLQLFPLKGKRTKAKSFRFLFQNVSLALHMDLHSVEKSLHAFKPLHLCHGHT